MICHVGILWCMAYGDGSKSRHVVSKWLPAGHHSERSSSSLLEKLMMVLEGLDAKKVAELYATNLKEQVCID